MSGGDAFSLRDVLAAAVESTVSPAHEEVAKTAYAAIDPDDYPEALRQAINMLTPHYIVATRPTRRGGKRSKRKRPVGPKLAAQIERFLKTREYSPLRGKDVFLRDCTADDLDSIAEARYLLAEQTHAKGDWFARCSKTVREYDVETFGELPKAVIDELRTEDEET